MPNGDSPNDGAVKCQACRSCRTRKLRCTKEATGCMRCTAEGRDCVYPLRRAMGRPTTKLPEPGAGSGLHIMRVWQPPRSAAAFGAFLPDRQHTSSSEFGIGIADCPEGATFGGQDFLLPYSHSESFHRTSNPSSSDLGANPTTLTSVAPCRCAERLLACADSLSTLPDDLWGALLTARHSSRTIYEVLKCQQCKAASGAAPDHPSQVIVILATVMFPLVGESYLKVADLVEKEAKRAMDDRQDLIFDLTACGGLWGPFRDRGIKCQEHYSELVLDVGSWRTTMRALLRTDLHGFDIQKPKDGDDPCPDHQPGLCDLISDIKSRSTSGLILHMIEMAQRSLSHQLAIT
ncbi:hypothetical protein B0T16DRAFT_407397 [Cercophora newfieldiana]|uniref:Zn(2)-C6 fungal-type domain-containing protein n=1 Tax=Cercophora newfieldiana TaxID=92897 RepID=A0AA39YK99_9PEZI|nr:hypothetical protein B0T16DRAFT_407397 [Cercophora newfieldiana]